MADFIILTADQAGMPWITFALDEFEAGIRGAVKGQGIDANIQGYWRRVTNNQAPDEAENINSVAWCASAVGSALSYAGIQHTASGWAGSFRTLNYPTTQAGSKIRWLAGEDVTSTPKHGAICHLSAANSDFTLSSFHVSFYVGEDATYLYLLGGNQGNAWNIGRYSKNNREYNLAWPKGWGQIAGNTITTPDISGNYRRLQGYSNGLVGAVGTADTRASKWGSRLKPMPLTDGNYALPVTVLTDPAHEEWADFLGGLTTRAITDTTEFIFYETTDGA